ncbi:MAG: ribosome-associated translation inhibitor RaiA [Anaerolineaceae bacterium]|nr:ribosome-associated translation inhibitor RaiA [Anaerolineaceae bacterium]
MDVIIQGHNMKVTDTLETYAKKKLDKLDRYLPNIREVRVDLSVQLTKRGENIAIAQITVHHSRGAILRAEEKLPGDARNAINSAVDKIFTQVQRFKGKRSRKGRERFTASIEEMNMAEAIPEIEEFVEEGPYASDGLQETGDSRIARRKTVSVTAMNEAEAIEQMELLGHTFFVFFNDTTGSVNVVYKRSAGDYGLLIPQET